MAPVGQRKVDLRAKAFHQTRQFLLVEFRRLQQVVGVRATSAAHSQETFLRVGLLVLFLLQALHTCRDECAYRRAVDVVADLLRYSSIFTNG